MGSLVNVTGPPKKRPAPQTPLDPHLLLVVPGQRCSSAGGWPSTDQGCKGKGGGNWKKEMMMENNWKTWKSPQLMENNLEMAKPWKLSTFDYLWLLACDLPPSWQQVLVLSLRQNWCQCTAVTPQTTFTIQNRHNQTLGSWTSNCRRSPSALRSLLSKYLT